MARRLVVLLIAAVAVPLLASPAARPQAGERASLTLRNLDGELRYGGGRARLAGRLTGVPAPGGPVRILSLRGGEETLLREVRPGADGRFSIRVRPRRRTIYIARHGDLRSRRVAVDVVASVGIADRETVSTATFEGAIRPRAGLVTLLRLEGCGVVEVDRAQVTGGRFAFTRRRVDGAYRVRFDPAAPGVGEGTSRNVFIGATGPPDCFITPEETR